MTSLELTLLYLFAAVLGVIVCRTFKLPPMLGYLAVGVVIGPNMLALAKNTQGIQHLAEFGIVFLMFAIGLEFNLPKLRTMRRHVFGLGLVASGLYHVGGYCRFFDAYKVFASSLALVLAGCVSAFGCFGDE